MADNIFVKLSKQLFPTGRAWWIRLNGIFHKLLQGLSLSEQRVHDATVFLLDAILPDNDNFDEEDAANWEKALGLYNQSYLSLADRKKIILRKMQHPGNIPARQHYLYLEGQLQNAGFDVYVHENRFGSPPVINNPVAAIYGEINYGQINYGNQGINHSKIINYIDANKDSQLIGDGVNMRATFFIGSQVFPNRADVPNERKKEFRELILKIKPAQTAGFLLINYI